MKKNTILMLSVTGGLLLAALVWVIVSATIMRQSIPEVVIDEASGYASTVSPESHRITNPENSEAVFVEFLDFECEACGAAYPYIEQAREEFGDRVTFIIRYFPLPGHLNSKTAAVAVEAASRQGKLIEMYQRMFETQAEWGEQQVSMAPLFREYAQSLGLDMVQYDADIADPTTLERVEADLNAGIALGVSGTPSLFVNDKPVQLTSIGDIRQSIVDALEPGSK